MPISNGYLPSTDNALSAWAQNFSTLITANYASYGLTTGQASAFATLKSNFVTALGLSTNVSTRTKSTVAAKNASKALMLASIRSLAAIVQGYPSTTNAQRQDLGLTVRDRHPTPIGPPTTQPIITVQALRPLAMDLRFADSETPSSRSRPAGAVACQIFAKVDGVAPTSLAQCRYMGTATKNTSGPGSRSFPITFDPADGNKTAYLIGVWVNRRGELGPVGGITQATVAA